MKQEAKKEYIEIINAITNDWDAKSYVPWGKYHPFEFTGWQKESLSWKTTAYIHAGLGCCLANVEIEGPDVIKLLTDLSVNSFNKFPVGSVRHIVMCNKLGNIMAHGVCLRLAEDKIRTIDLDPYISWQAKRGNYDVTCTNVNEERFVFQIAGPKSLEIIEHAAKRDLHDLKFMRFVEGEIAGHPVQLLRMGMAGTLSYEVQGEMIGAQEVYRAILEAGEPYGLLKLGTRTYVCNHTENGFPQQGAHFALAWLEDEEFAQYCRETMEPVFNNVYVEPRGTYTHNVHDLFRNPFEVGWGNLVKFNHDFIGREALEKIAENPKRTVVTLKWDPDDFVKIFRSQFDEEPVKLFEMPINYASSGQDGNWFTLDLVEKDGKEAGISVWPVYTPYYRSVISMGFINIEEAEIGNKVVLYWGEKDGKQVAIKATVERFPYLDLPTNREYDIESIPHYEG